MGNTWHYQTPHERHERQDTEGSALKLRRTSITQNDPLIFCVNSHNKAGGLGFSSLT